MLLQGRSHIGTLVEKGDRDFATNVDLQIESAVRDSLARAAPGIPFLGEEEGGGAALDAGWGTGPDRRDDQTSPETVRSALSPCP